MSARLRPPSYRLHKATGQAIVTLGGKDIYLGPHGTQVSKDNYDRHVGEWLQNGRQRRPAASSAVTIIEVCAAFNGSDELARSSHRSEYKKVMRVWLRLYGRDPIDDFGPLALKVVREAFVADGLKRKTVNARIDQLRRIVRWAVGQQMASITTLQALESVEGLRKGATVAPESKKVKGVALTHVQACLTHMGTMLGDMVQIQGLTGMRAAELLQMRTGDLNTGGKTWIYKPGKHKTEQHDIIREIAIGPKAIALLEKWLLPDLDAIIFSPVRAEEVRLAELRERRVTPLHLGNRPGSNRVKQARRAKGRRYSTASYRRAIWRATDRAFPPPAALARAKGENDAKWRKRLGPDKWKLLLQDRKQYRWSPHQLRHAFGQMARDIFGIEHAQASLGHTRASTTEIYAKAQQKKATQVARKLG